MSNAIHAAALAMAMTGQGGELAEYIQGSSQLFPERAGVLYMYTQVHSMECQNAPLVSDIKAFEDSIAYSSLVSLSGSSPLGVSKFQSVMKKYNQKIDCGEVSQ